MNFGGFWCPCEGWAGAVVLPMGNGLNRGSQGASSLLPQPGVRPPPLRSPPSSCAAVGGKLSFPRVLSLLSISELQTEPTKKNKLGKKNPNPATILPPSRGGPTPGQPPGPAPSPAAPRGTAAGGLTPALPAAPLPGGERSAAQRELTPEPPLHWRPAQRLRSPRL